MAHDYNPYQDQKRTESDFNMALGTSDRMNFCLWKVNIFFELGQYHQMFTQLQILFDEISTFVNDINKTGVLVGDTEFIEAQRLETVSETELFNCYQTQRDGQQSFRVTIILVRALREYQRYLRALMFKYKLYIKTRDLTLAAMKVG